MYHHSVIRFKNKAPKISTVAGAFKLVLVEICKSAKLRDLVLPLLDLDRSVKIGSYETSILPYEDCCTVFLPDFPVTRPKMEDILREERKLDVNALLNEALATLEVIDIE